MTVSGNLLSESKIWRSEAALSVVLAYASHELSRRYPPTAINLHSHQGLNTELQNPVLHLPCQPTHPHHHHPGSFIQKPKFHRFFTRKFLLWTPQGKRELISKTFGDYQGTMKCGMDFKIEMRQIKTKNLTNTTALRSKVYKGFLRIFRILLSGTNWTDIHMTWDIQ